MTNPQRQSKKLFISFIGVVAVIAAVGITVRLSQTRQILEQSAAGMPTPVISLSGGCYVKYTCEHACPATNPNCCGTPQVICPSKTPTSFPSGK